MLLEHQDDGWRDGGMHSGLVVCRASNRGEALQGQSCRSLPCGWPCSGRHRNCPCEVEGSGLSVTPAVPACVVPGCTRVIVLLSSLPWSLLAAQTVLGSAVPLPPVLILVPCGWASASLCHRASEVGGTGAPPCRASLHLLQLHLQAWVLGLCACTEGPLLQK